jgi:hypothetical protein
MADTRAASEGPIGEAEAQAPAVVSESSVLRPDAPE